MPKVSDYELEHLDDETSFEKKKVKKVKKEKYPEKRKKLRERKEEL